MTDAADSPVVGKTRWRRVPLVLVPVYVMLAGILYLAASGSLAVSFAISGTSFDTFANSLSCGFNGTTPNTTDQDGNGQCFYQLGVFDVSRASTTPPAMDTAQLESVFPNAQITNLCQSVSVTVPVLGTTTVVTRAGNGAGGAVKASMLVTDASTTTADAANFNNFKVGVDLSGFSNPTITEPNPFVPASGANVSSIPVPTGTFGQTATNVQLSGLHSKGLGTQAASFTLPNLSLGIVGVGGTTGCP